MNDHLKRTLNTDTNKLTALIGLEIQEGYWDSLKQARDYYRDAGRLSAFTRAANVYQAHVKAETLRTDAEARRLGTLTRAEIHAMKRAALVDAIKAEIKAGRYPSLAAARRWYADAGRAVEFSLAAAALERERI